MSSDSAGPSSAAAAARQTNIQSTNAGSAASRADASAASYDARAAANSPFSRWTRASRRNASAAPRAVSGIRVVPPVVVRVGFRLFGLQLLERDELAHLAA